jgi:hypothetical protein
MGNSILLFTVLTVITLIVLITGIVVMTKGGELNRKYANKIMILRVVFQLAAVLILGGVYFLAK